MPELGVYGTDLNNVAKTDDRSGVHMVFCGFHDYLCILCRAGLEISVHWRAELKR